MNTTQALSVIVERVFNAPVEKIWSAITERDQMKHWYFDLKEFKAEVGFEFQFTGGKDDRSYLHLCKVTEVVVNKKLKYSWRYDGFEGNSFVTFELIPQGNQTKLKLSHEGLESFPSNVADFDRKNFSDGWNYIVNTSLKSYLESDHR